MFSSNFKKCQFRQFPPLIYNIVHRFFSKMGLKMATSFMVLYERAHFELSGKHKISEIEPSKLKLWALENGGDHQYNHVYT